MSLRRNNDEIDSGGSNGAESPHLLSPQTMGRVALRSGDLSLELAPLAGGSVAAFRLDSTDLFRPMDPSATDALHSGMFPMAPFANCIRDNTFEVNGKCYRITPNVEGSTLNFHGSAWQLAWNVVEQSSDRATIFLPGAKVDDAYIFDAEQRFQLSQAGLDVRLSVTNRSHVRMPFCMGLHPWFPRHGNALLAFSAAGLWTEEAGGVVGELIPVTGENDFTTMRSPPFDRRNNCYTGWSGAAAIAWPDLSVGLSMFADSIFSHLMFHVPSDAEPPFCVEPQSSAPCAFDGLADGRVRPGVFVIEPGESIGGTVRFAPVRRNEFEQWRHFMSHDHN